MMAMLFAIRMVEGRTTWEQVPAKLRGQVAKILIEDFDMPELVPVEAEG